MASKQTFWGTAPSITRRPLQAIIVDSMNTLRLGAHALSPGEVVLVQTLFRLYGRDRPFPWTFVTAPPYDALLVDGTATDQAEHMARAVLRLTRMNAADAPGTLQRPIRADRFQDWLRAIEADLLEPTLVPPPAAVGPMGQVEAVRFRLRRWPPAILLRADPRRVRLATLLSRRALCSVELAQLSQQTPAECQSFLSLLQSAGLVERDHPMPASGVTATPPAAPHRARPGWVASIRRRLGL